MSYEELISKQIKEELPKEIKPLLDILGQILEELKEKNKPYIHWGKDLSPKQAMKYTGRTRSCLDKWVEEGLLKKPYRIGGSTSVYYSKDALDSIAAKWQGIVNEKAKGTLKTV